jgi:hypothetical protein
VAGTRLHLAVKEDRRGFNVFAPAYL